VAFWVQAQLLAPVRSLAMKVCASGKGRKNHVEIMVTVPFELHEKRMGTKPLKCISANLSLLY